MDAESVQLALFSTALGRALAAARLTPQEVQARGVLAGEPVPLTTLRAWLAGTGLPRTQAEYRALAAIEQILGVRPGGLIATSTPPKPVRPDDPATQRQTFRRGDVLARTLIAMNLQTKALPPTRLDLVMELDEGRRERRLVCRERRIAAIDGADRWAVVYMLDEPLAQTAMAYAGAGCSRARVTQEPTVGLMVAELVLPEPLRAGEHADVEFVIEIPPGGVSFRYEHTFATACEIISIGVRFDPADPPMSVEAYAESAGRDRPLPVVRPEPGLARTTVTDFGPGIVALGWEWPD